MKKLSIFTEQKYTIIHVIETRILVVFLVRKLLCLAADNGYERIPERQSDKTH